MKEIDEIIVRMGIERKLPQFLFCSGIHPESAMQLRQEVLTYKKNNPDTSEVDFIIHSPGGSPADAYRIIRSLRNNFETVNVVVPFWAKSAATLLSLGANTIIMDEFGEFGPLDIQIGIEREDSPEMDIESALNDEYSVRRIETRSQELYYEMFVNLYSNPHIKINKNELSSQLLKYLASFYEPLLRQINPYNLGKKKRKLDIGEQYAQRILLTYNSHIPELTRRRLVDYLVNGCPDHGYVIDYQIISVFMPNVQKTIDVSEVYCNTVTELSSILIPLHNYSFVGFIEGGDESPDNTELKEELVTNVSENGKDKIKGTKNEKGRQSK